MGPKILRVFFKVSLFNSSGYRPFWPSGGGSIPVARTNAPGKHKLLVGYFVLLIGSTLAFYVACL